MTDLASEDLLTHFPATISFISEGQSKGAVLVHCFYGKSRSATVVTAHLMHQYRITVERALDKVKAKRPCVNPNPGFMAQLRLWEAMKWKLDDSHLRCGTKALLRLR